MRSARLAASVAAAGTVAGAAVGGYVGLVTGSLTLDLGIGRQIRPLGPISLVIAAPRQTVYDAAAAPYSLRPSRALQAKVQVLERGSDMVLAAHRTPVGGRLTAITVETVTFDPPREIRFRLLRGPVPFVEETFTFTEHDHATTTLIYQGTLGTDLWAVGQAWGRLVGSSWEDAVAKSLAEIKQASERATGAR